MTNLQRVEAALRHLAAARDLLRAAGAHRTLARVRLAISSARGARRHADLEPYRRERQAGTGPRLHVMTRDAEPETPDAPPELCELYRAQ